MTTDLWEGPVPRSRCPNCATDLDAALNSTGDEGPEPGDATICWYCGAFAVFTEHLALRPPTSEEIEVFTANTDAQKVLHARRAHPSEWPDDQ